MAIQSFGYLGTVAPGGTWAQVLAYGGGARYCCPAVTGVRVSSYSGGTRQVQVSPGVAAGWGIVDTLTATETVTLPTESFTGTRYYLIVLRRTWSSTPGASATTLAVISGGSAATLPTRTTGPGNVDDQPLALVPLTSGDTVPGAPIDVRLIGSGSGPYAAASDLVRQYATDIGTVISIGDARWERALNAAGTGAVWKPLWSPGTRVALTKLTSSQVWASAAGWSGASDACQQIGILNGNSFTLAVQLRRTGDLIAAGTSGAMVLGDVTVGQINDPRLWPSIEWPVRGSYLGGVNATSKSSFGCDLTVYPSGKVNLNALSPQADLTKAATGADSGKDWSIRFGFTYNREDAS